MEGADELAKIPSQEKIIEGILDQLYEQNNLIVVDWIRKRFTANDLRMNN